jgi:hypothetical protein
MQEYIKKSKPWKLAWLLVWAVMYLLVILAYPSKPSIWFGWMPGSVITTFGLMVVTLILGYVFCKQRFKT